MHSNRTITEERDSRSSISLHDHTEVQEYPGLDSSNDYIEGSSGSDDRSLNSLRRYELECRYDSQIEERRQRRSGQGPPAFVRSGNNPVAQNNIRGRYDFDLEPSTQDQSRMQQLNRSRPKPNPSPPQKRQPQEHGFAMDSWLNAQPVAPRNKKGVEVLGARKQRNSHNRDRDRLNRSVAPEPTIELVTLTELEDQEEAMERVRAAEEILQDQSRNSSQRMAAVRYNFMRNFLPTGLKPTTPFAMLKYIQSRN